MSIESVMPSNHLVLCRPLLLLPSILCSITVFSNEYALHIGWPKYWSFSISPSSEYSGLISFRVDWFDLLAVQETLMNLLQHYSSKASILRHSAFFMVQLSHLYMTTGKTIALTIWTLVDKVMSLLFNMLSRFVIAFLLRNFMATVTVHSDFEAQENKICHYFYFFSHLFESKTMKVRYRIWRLLKRLCTLTPKSGPWSLWTDIALWKDRGENPSFPESSHPSLSKRPKSMAEQAACTPVSSCYNFSFKT